MEKIEILANQAIKLLQSMIWTPSFSGQELAVADLIENYLIQQGFNPQRKGNNVWVRKVNQIGFPTVMLNSHIDTVKPNKSYTRDPFNSSIESGKLYGLGSNDAGGSLVAMMHSFIALYDERLPYNLVFAATAEEENSGAGGITSILEELGSIELGIIGEPTGMRMATAEKGLMVVDCMMRGKAGHAALNEGDNAIYKVIADLEWVRNFRFPKRSEHLSDTKMTITQIKAGVQHNVVPDTCEFVIDVRVNEKYTNQEAFEIIKAHLGSEVKARSMRLNSSSISHSHPAIVRGQKLGIECYGSPTLSDQALLSFNTFKMGPGDSRRSHSADEFIYIHEIEEGLANYCRFLRGLVI